MAYHKTLIYNELAELYPLWRDALLHGDKEAQKKQIKFLETILSEKNIQSIIDLGGGIGTHGIPLLEKGYSVNIFDASKEALNLASKTTKKIKTTHGRFEQIKVKENFEASICMWSTINYLLNLKDRKHFLNWISQHSSGLIVIDQPNFLAYPKTFSKTYEVEDQQTKLKIIRSWKIKNQIRKTDFIYEIENKKTGKIKKIKDREIQRFITLPEINQLIGKDWSAKYVLGDYDTKKPFNPKLSQRLITVFEKSNSITPKAAFHGGDFFQAINVDFSKLENSKKVVNADVLDAWFNPSPKVISKIKKYLPFSLRTSPPTYCAGLIEAIAKYRMIPANNILVGGGSSDLAFTFFPNILKKNDTALILDPMYGEYQHIFENVLGIKLFRYKLNEDDDFKITVSSFIHEIKKIQPKIIVIVNPNSPTGQVLNQRQIITILKSIPKETLFVVDETYIDYTGQNQSLETQVTKYDNLAVLKSMSKVYALSGVRVGYLAASENIIQKIKKFIPPWAVSFQGQIAAIEALKDKDYYKNKYKETNKLKTDLIKKLRKSPSLKVYNSGANFILLELSDPNLSAKKIINKLKGKYIFLRNCDSMSEQFNDNFIRISVRNKKQNAKIIKELHQALTEKF